MKSSLTPYKRGFNAGTRRAALAVCPVPHIEEERSTEDVIDQINSLTPPRSSQEYTEGFNDAIDRAIKVANTQGESDCVEISRQILKANRREK